MFLCIFACCPRFLICISSLISHPGFEFLSVFFLGILILVQTNFSPAYISSFYSLMLFVEICINNSFIFSVFALTIFLSWFLKESRVVFFSDIILFTVSVFIFSSCVWVCSVVFRCVVFRLPLLCVSIWLGCSCFSVITVLYSGFVHVIPYFIRWCVSKPFFTIVQAFCLKSSAFFQDFWHSFPIAFVRGCS